MGGKDVTVGKAIELADRMRENNPFDHRLKQEWLRQLDARLRMELGKSAALMGAEGADAGWSDGLEEEWTLLAQEPWDAIYPQWLCTQMDLALGEAQRYGLMMQEVQRLEAELCAQMRRMFPPEGGARWKL